MDTVLYKFSSVDERKCCGCGGCMQKCPTGAISMRENDNGFYYPVVDERKCIKCGSCLNVCPVINVAPDNMVVPISYGAYCLDMQMRRKSASGGIFAVLANYVIEQGGVVFGAAFANDFTSVEHISINNVLQIGLLQSSKYVQSDIGKTYKNAEEILQEGRIVLYTGTPCQIEGLKCFLGHDYKNLYLQDCICYGVPCAKQWKNHLEYLRNGSEKVVSVNFRSKKFGWHKYGLSVLFDDEREYFGDKKSDAYLMAFQEGNNLRSSCYLCPFRKLHRVSDFTLADFWGARYNCPELNNDEGLSFVQIHSNKGVELFGKIGDQIRFAKVDNKETLRAQPYMLGNPKQDVISCRNK